MSGSIYTQPFDVESEQNGVMTYDRAVIKVPLPELSRMHARLWPTTKNAITVTAGVTAAVADTLDPDYPALLASYQSGNRDLEFMRRLALMADARQDRDAARRIATDYIGRLPDPVTERNVQFTVKFTTQKSDPGFAILRANLGKIVTVTDPRWAQRKVQELIFADEVKSLLTDRPDWDAVDGVVRRYPEINGERILGLCVFHYGSKAVAASATDADRWNFVAAAKRYDAKFPGGQYNSWAWMLFQTSADTLELQAALTWSQKAVEQSTGLEKAMATDTYANLLHKLGRTEDALQWQAKAVAAKPDDAEIKANYDKMKKGEPTWPVKR